MTISIKEIAWLAGLLEGEGCFSITGTTPIISVASSDRDVIKKVKLIMTSENAILFHSNGHKGSHSYQINSWRAISWMMTIYSLMSIRRKEKIKEILMFWKSHISTRGPIKLGKGDRCRNSHLIVGKNAYHLGGIRYRCRICMHGGNRPSRIKKREMLLEYLKKREGDAYKEC